MDEIYFLICIPASLQLMTTATTSITNITAILNNRTSSIASHLFLILLPTPEKKTQNDHHPSRYKFDDSYGHQDKMIDCCSFSAVKYF